MRLPQCAANVVVWKRHAFALQQFLQQRFGVLAADTGVYGGKAVAKQLTYDVLRDRKTAIEHGGADDGFNRICKNGGTLRAPALQFAFAEQQMLTQVQVQRDAMQCRLIYQVGTQS